jgi:hypothetical protein
MPRSRRGLVRWKRLLWRETQPGKPPWWRMWRGRERKFRRVRFLRVSRSPPGKRAIRRWMGKRREKRCRRGRSRFRRIPARKRNRP